MPDLLRTSESPAIEAARIAATQRLAVLRSRIRQIEQGSSSTTVSLTSESFASSDQQASSWILDIAGLEPTLQPPALVPAALQEIAPASAKDQAAAAAFALTLLLQHCHRDGRNAGDNLILPLLWCQTAQEARDVGRLYPPGLVPWRIGPGALLLVEARRDKEVLWAMEEGLRSQAVAAAVGELGTDKQGGKADLTATRRLALAAQQSGRPCLLLRSGGSGLASAARTRWRIAGAPSWPGTLDPKSPGKPCWRVELTRSPQGRLGAWTLEWSHETDRFRLAAAMADRPAAARQTQRAA